MLISLAPSLATAVSDHAGRQASTYSLQFASAETCRTCHAEIYAEWKQSWMSRAYTNPLFQNDFARWKKMSSSSGQSGDSCLRCHAPVAVLTGDTGLQNSTSREGVSCTVCHKVALTREQEDQYFLVMDPRPVLYGASGDKSFAAHEIRHGQALTDSTLCAGCHHDVSDGLPLERTFQEWHGSAYADSGTHCADCHMPPVTLRRNGKTTTHRSHRFPGGHSSSPLLESAARIEVTDAGQTQARVTVTNATVGHHFPTGGAHPARLVLTVEFVSSSARVLHTEERTYALVFLNAKGQPTSGRDAVESLRDTTLRPQESRIETFELPSTITGDYTLRAKLVYSLIPPGMEKEIPGKIFTVHYRPVVIATTSKRYTGGVAKEVD